VLFGWQYGSCTSPGRTRRVSRTGHGRERERIGQHLRLALRGQPVVQFLDNLGTVVRVMPFAHVILAPPLADREAGGDRNHRNGERPDQHIEFGVPAVGRLLQVAIDAISAKLQGFDPLSIPFIRTADELDLGVGDPKEIEIVGYDIEEEKPWHFVQEDTFASRGQKMIYHGWLKPLEKVLLQSPIVPWSYFASNFYHNVYWYPFVGRTRVEAALKAKWGKLFASYGDGEVVLPGMEPKTVIQAAIGLIALLALIIIILVLAIK